jgi:hypothetical protein
MNNSRPGRADQASSTSESDRSDSGFTHRLRDGGVARIVGGRDLYISIAATVGLLLVYAFFSHDIVAPALVANSIPLSISLVAFILAAVSLLISFSDQRFLRLLHDLDVYNTLLFNFEFTLYLSLMTTVVGILLQSYESLFYPNTVYIVGFHIFVFFFVYMVLSTANLVSVVVSIGKRKARFLSKAD